MWWPIRYQWLVPFGTILVVAVAVTSISSAWLAAKHSTAITLEQLNRVIDTLGQSRFPFSQNVLEQMRGLSGAEAELGERILDVLVTGKPEGVGFGLALANQVALEQGGTLTWSRDNGETSFRLRLAILQ